MLKLTHVNVWVHDQDEALAFYTEKLGMELRDDITLPEMGNFRWLTVGPVGQPDVALVLMAVPGPPVFEPETSEQLKVAAREGRHGRALLHDRRRPGRLRGSEGRGVEFVAGADRAAVRGRRGLPRHLGQPHADDAGGTADARRDAVGRAGALHRGRAPCRGHDSRVSGFHDEEHELLRMRIDLRSEIPKPRWPEGSSVRGFHDSDGAAAARAARARLPRRRRQRGGLRRLAAGAHGRQRVRPGALLPRRGRATSSRPPRSAGRAASSRTSSCTRRGGATASARRSCGSRSGRSTGAGATTSTSRCSRQRAGDPPLRARRHARRSSASPSPPADRRRGERSARPRSGPGSRRRRAGAAAPARPSARACRARRGRAAAGQRVPRPARDQVAAPSGEDVLDPVGVGAVRQRDDALAAVAEDVDGRAVLASRLATHVHDHAEAGQPRRERARDAVRDGG